MPFSFASITDAGESIRAAAGILSDILGYLWQYV
jgi:hypothetical protein